MRRELRCVLVGDSGVGKSTIITSLVKESWAPRVQRVVPELTLPPSVSPDGVTIKIIDTAAVATASSSEQSSSSSRGFAHGPLSSPAPPSSTSGAFPGSPTPSSSSTHPRPSGSGSHPLTPADQQRAHLEAEIRRASVICLVYSIATPSSFERIPTFWLPYIRSILSANDSAHPPQRSSHQQGANGYNNHSRGADGGGGNFRNASNGTHPPFDEDDDHTSSGPTGHTIPIILVGNKIDLRSSDPSLSSHPSELTQAALEQELAPVMAEFREVETCVEASAFLHINISEIFYFAQKAVLYPTAPLYDSREQKLRGACIDALKRIFLLCDNDQDGVLNDRELDNFQRRCFDAPLHPQELEGVKELVLAAPMGGHANYASYESGYGSSSASASGAGGYHQGQPRRSTGGGGGSVAGSRHAPEGRGSVSGSSATASSTTAMGNGRRYRNTGRADSFTSNETVSNSRHRRRTLSSSSSTSASHRRQHPHIRNGGLTLAGFLYLHTIFIQRGRLETTWTVLRSFGYACPSLLLEESYVHPPFQIPPDHAVELSPHGYQFLTDVFEAHDKDRDGALSESELDHLFVIAPGGEHPWGRRHGADFPEETTTTDQKGNITLQGWLAQWSMTTLLEPRTTLAYMAYLGYPSYGVSVTGPMTPPAGANSGAGKSGASGSGSGGGGIRSYFSSKAGGKSESASSPSSAGGSGGFWSSGSSSSSATRRNVKPRSTGPPPTTTALKVVKIPRKAERERFLRRGFGMSTPSTTTTASSSSTNRNAKGNNKKKGVPQRSVLLGYVFGAAGSGKTALLRAMVGREFDPLPSTGRHGILPKMNGSEGKERERDALSTHSVVSAVEYAGAEKYLVLQEFEAAQEAEVLKSPKRLAAADVAVFVYDATDPASFAYLVNLREAHPQLGGLPSLFVATKADLLYPGLNSGLSSGMMSPVSGGGGGGLGQRRMYGGSPESVLGSSPPRELYRVRSPSTPSPAAGGGNFGSSELMALTRRNQQRKNKNNDHGVDEEEDDEDDDATISAAVDPRTYCAELGLSIPALHNDAGPLELSVRAGRLADVYSVLCAIALEPTGAIPDAAAWDREMSRRRREGSWVGWLFGSSSSSGSGVGRDDVISPSSGKKRKAGRRSGEEEDEGRVGGGKRKGLVRWQTGSKARWVLFVVVAVGGAAISFRLWGVAVSHRHGRPGEAGLGLWRSVLLGGGGGGGGEVGEGGFHAWVKWARASLVGAEVPVHG
ncbi:hypothetical protein CF327_g3982 [Tilletia walkeri]|nr:hypothetical protein CF327_g3982 [Tilletia walkeri]